MEVKIYQDEHGNEPFTEWLNSLRDAVTRRRIRKRLRRIERGNLGDFGSVGDGVFELRLHFGAGYRIYYVYINEETTLLLTGGDKNSQARDIQKAKRFWGEHNGTLK